MKSLNRAHIIIFFLSILWVVAGCQQKAQEAKVPQAAEKAASAVTKVAAPSAGEVQAQAAPVEPEPVPEAAPQAEVEKTGAALFKQHCDVCHAGGGNIINAEKTLSAAHREANNVNTVEAMVNQMRNPGPGMSVFDTEQVSDEEARMIAEYILETFK